jgi:hypothetical protein
MSLPIELHDPDWAMIRQTLAFALARVRPVCLRRGADYLRDNPGFTPLFDDMRHACAVLGAGELELSSDDMVFYPACPRTGTFELETGRFSSAVELLLFVLPALFQGDFRTVLTIRGVTHSPHAPSTGFVKETLLPLLEMRGHYASLTLQRFGYYASGGGSFEARAYPAEFRELCQSCFSGPRRIEGARVFAAGVSMDLATREVELVRGALDLDEARVSLLDIRDADGMGNSVQVFLRCGREMLVLGRDMELYDWQGDFIFDEGSFNATLHGLFEETRRFLGGGVPSILARELLPFWGSDAIRSRALVSDGDEAFNELLRIESLITGF